MITINNMKHIVGISTVIILVCIILFITIQTNKTVSLKSANSDFRVGKFISKPNTNPLDDSNFTDEGYTYSIEELQEAILEDKDISMMIDGTASGTNNTLIPLDFTTQLQTANFGFTVNDKVNINDYAIAKFTIDTTKTIEEIRNNLEDIGIMVTDSISISKLVLVDIIAPDFEVTSISPNKQPINPNGSTNWKWKLKPKSEGNYPVELTVYAQVNIDGIERSTFINSYDKSVTIEITGKQKIERWWENNWQWAWTTLIIPIGLYFREKITNLFKKKDI